MQTTKMNRPYNNVTFNEKDEKYFMDVALPGLSKEDITVETEDDLLIINTAEKEGGSILNFDGKTWKFRLPHRADIDAIQASVENGILSIEIPLKVVRRSIKVA